MPFEEESEKVSRNSEIESLCQSLNSLYKDIIKNVESAQNKFPLQSTENKCSRDNLLCYLALREHDLSDLQLKLAEQGLSSLGRLESQVIVSIEKVIKSLGLSPHETGSLCKSNSTDARLSLSKRSQSLLGRSREGRRTRIMVTLDSSNKIGMMISNDSERRPSLRGSMSLTWLVLDIKRCAT